MTNNSNAAQEEEESDEAYVLTNDDIANLLTPTNKGDKAQAITRSSADKDASPNLPAGSSASVAGGSVNFDNSVCTTPSNLFDHNRSFYANSNASSRKITTPRYADKKVKNKANKQSFSSSGSASTNEDDDDDEEEEEERGGGGGRNYIARIKASIARRAQGSVSVKSQYSISSKIRVARRRGKVAVFRRQMRYLFVALGDRSLLVTLGLWVVGNAVYTVRWLFDILCVFIDIMRVLFMFCWIVNRLFPHHSSPRFSTTTRCPSTKSCTAPTPGTARSSQ
jgi:hypothetical protein